MLQQMVASNPQAQALLSNPEYLRQMMNPANLQAMLQMQRSMQQLQAAGIMPPVPGMPPFGGGVPGTGAYGGASAGAAAYNGLDFSSLLGGSGVGARTPSYPTSTVGSSPPPVSAPPPVTVSPAVRFATQQQQLQDMGFTDVEANLRALTAANGNVNSAVERLLSS